MFLSRPATAAWRRADRPSSGACTGTTPPRFRAPRHLLAEKTQSKKDRVRKAISKAISGVESGLCYASALCLAVRLELLGAKTSLQDSNCRFDTLDLKPLTKNQGKQNR